MTNDKYVEIFLEPVRKCKHYRPKLGNSKQKDGFSLAQFTALYGADPFYSWIGLDSALMYSAHRAAGGMTSVYRQIGIGCERLFREIIVDTTGYIDPDLAEWSYTTKMRSGKKKKVSLDGRLELSEIQNAKVLQNVNQWISNYCHGLDNVEKPKNGIVFQVCQGYKSKDSKRQHADLDNATVAWANSYLPVFAIFSSQIDTDIVLRYRNNRCGILIGIDNNDAFSSLYAFTKNVLGYDLADFFRTNTDKIQKEINEVLEILLSPE